MWFFFLLHVLIEMIFFFFFCLCWTCFWILSNIKINKTKQNNLDDKLSSPYNQSWVESTDAAPRSPHLSPTWHPTSDSPTLPFFFFWFAPTQPDSRQLGPIQADLGGNGNQYGRNSHQNMLIWPILVETAAETGRNGQWLPFFCFMWPCERKKKEGRKRWEDKKIKKIKKGWKKNKGM